MSKVFVFLYDVLIAFKAETCLNPTKWIIAMAVRGYILYLLCWEHYSDYIMAKLPMDSSNTLSACIYDILPSSLCLFMLWWFFTTLIMFLAVFYYQPALTLKSEPDYSEIDKFLNWRDNKMKFMSYPEAQKLMQDSAILNNLDKSNPQAKQTLDYINNKMRFMSYTESLDFLRGKK